MSFNKQRILIVDDNNEILDILSEFLLMHGFEVECAVNGLEALSLFSENHFDAVLTDFQMPLMNGLNLAHEVRIKEPKTLIIMMTSDVWMNTQKYDFIDYIVDKPFRSEAIYSILQGAFESKVPVYL